MEQAIKIFGLTLNPPRSFEIFGLDIYFYGLIIALAYAVAGIYLYRRKKEFSLTRDNVLDLLLLAVIFGLIGARVYYVLFSLDEYIGQPWHALFNVRQGGLAIYGGIIGSAAAILVYCKIKKLNLYKTLDIVGPSVMIGQAIGRWGNFFNREAHGTETKMPWGMGLEQSDGSFIYYHPTFLYECLWNVLGFVLLHLYSKKAKHRYNGQLFLMYICWYGFGRMIIEGLRTDSLMAGEIRVSQLLAAVLFAVSFAALAAFRIRKKGYEPEPVTAAEVEIEETVVVEEYDESGETDDAEEYDESDESDTTEPEETDESDITDQPESGEEIAEPGAAEENTIEEE